MNPTVVAGPARLGSGLDAAGLRRQFDESFARPVTELEQEGERFVLVRVGIDGPVYAIQLTEVAAILPVRKLVTVPSSLPALLGLVAVRGEVVPVYGVASLLGLAQEPTRWFAQCNDADSVGLAFGQLEGYVEVQANQASARGAGAGSGAPSRRLIHSDLGTHGVLELGTLVQDIRDRIGATRVDKET